MPTSFTKSWGSTRAENAPLGPTACPCGGRVTTDGSSPSFHFISLESMNQMTADRMVITMALTGWTAELAELVELLEGSPAGS